MSSQSTAAHTKRRKADPDQKWLAANATAVEQIEAFREWSESQWGMPTFAVLRVLVESIRFRDAIAAAKAGA